MRTAAKESPRRSSTPYVERVNLAIDCVVSRLAEPGGRLRLVEVARAAGLSPFHFHRVFQMLMGETLADFVKRLRLEKALVMMCHGAGAPRRRGRRLSLTRVAMACGFSSSSDFSRCFKQRFGAAPSAFDTKAWRADHGAELEAIVDGAVKGGARLHLDRLPRLPLSANPDGFRVRIRDLPARTVAYIRVRNPYRSDAVVTAVQRLIAWAERHSLADGQWLGYQWENPEITPLDRCVYHTAVEVPQGRFTPKGEIGRFRFPPMVVAQVEVRGGIDLELRALQWLFGVWLPTSGYVPDDHPCFEAFIGRPFAHGAEYFELYAHLPVRQR